MVLEEPFSQVGRGIVSDRRLCIRLSGEFFHACKPWLHAIVRHPSNLTARRYLEQNLSCPAIGDTLHVSEADVV